MQKWPMARLQAGGLVETGDFGSSLQLAEEGYFAHLIHCTNYPEPEGWSLRGEEEQMYFDEPCWQEPPGSTKYYERRVDSEMWLAVAQSFSVNLLEDFLVE